jgi:zinc transport system substrate-binding protein
MKFSNNYKQEAINMKNLKKIMLIGLVFPLILGITLINHSNAQTPQRSADPALKIAVSVLPQTEWIQEIGGNNVEVQALIPAGASPATYSPTANELTYLGNADVWFQIGLITFDIANEDALVENAKPGMQVINLSVGLDLLELGSIDHQEEEHEDDDHEEHSSPVAAEDEHDHEEGAIDPHIWNSPTRVIQMVQKINQTLSTIDPTNAATYASNTAAYITKLEQLNSSISETMAGVQNRHMIIFHPSWGYFAHDYDLEMIALEDEGKDPSSEHFAEVIEIAKDKQVGTIFTQAEFSAEQAQAFSEEVCVEIVTLYPLAPNYIENMNTTANLIAEKLDQAPDCSAQNLAIDGFPLQHLAILPILSILALAIQRRELLTR